MHKYLKKKYAEKNNQYQFLRTEMKASILNFKDKKMILGQGFELLLCIRIYIYMCVCMCVCLLIECTLSHKELPQSDLF